jgi:hypothetical protein
MNLQRPWLVQISLLADSVTSEYPPKKLCIAIYLYAANAFL